MDARKSCNKITEIVKLQQMLRRWKRLSSRKSIPKGFLAVCVGAEMKRFVIPTEYLGHGAFAVLLREAEEEFGFEQEGVLRIPCDVSVFERILRIVDQEKKTKKNNKEHEYHDPFLLCCCSSENVEFAQCHHILNSACR